MYIEIQYIIIYVPNQHPRNQVYKNFILNKKIYFYIFFKKFTKHTDFMLIITELLRFLSLIIWCM